MENQLNVFLEFLQTERNYSENTTAAYRNDLGQFMSWIQETHPELSRWPDVQFDVVTGYVDHLKHQSYTASSVARKAAAIKSFFHLFCCFCNIIERISEKLDRYRLLNRVCLQQV